MHPVFIDCDTGEDDALALLLAVKHRLPLCGVVSCFGNSSIERTTRNSADVLAYAGAFKVPVLQGSGKPLQPHLHRDRNIDALEFVGENGLCNMVLPRGGKVKIVRTRSNLAERLLGRIEQEGPVDYIVTGPCTNLARVLLHDIDAARRSIARVFIMGGALSTPGNTGPTNPKTGAPYSEFNFYCDPYAADVVVSSGLPTYIVSWDTTATMTVSFDRFRKLKAKDSVGEFTLRLMSHFYHSFGLSLGRSFELNDPITVLAAMGEGAFSEKRIRIITDGVQFGRSVLHPRGSKVHLMSLSRPQAAALLERAIAALGLHEPKILE